MSMLFSTTHKVHGHMQLHYMCLCLDIPHTHTNTQIHVHIHIIHKIQCFSTRKVTQILFIHKSTIFFALIFGNLIKKQPKLNSERQKREVKRFLKETVNNEHHGQEASFCLHKLRLLSSTQNPKTLATKKNWKRTNMGVAYAKSSLHRQSFNSLSLNFP